VAELKHDKYIVTGEKLKHDMKLPQYRIGALRAQQQPPEQSTRVMWLDNTVVPGGFYTECVWFLPGMASEEPTVGTHEHSFDEVIAFFGTDHNNMHDLGGEIELWLEDERIVMNQTFLAFVPAGMKHCPLILRRIDRPIFHFTVGPGKEYG